MRTVSAFWKIFDRFNEYHVDIFLLYLMLAGYYVTLYADSDNLRLLLWLGLANLCILVGTHALSKFFDRPEDRVNKQHLGQAAYTYLPYVAIGAFALGVVGYGLVWPVFLPYAAVFIGVGILYSVPTRRRIKNLLFLKNLVPALIWFVSLQLLAAASGATTLATAMSHNAVAFVLFLAFEILWDIPDIQGDRIRGVRTLPSVFGVIAAKAAVAALIALVFLISSSFMTKIIAVAIAGGTIALPPRTPKRYYHLVVYLIAFILAYFLINEAIT